MFFGSKFPFLVKESTLIYGTRLLFWRQKGEEIERNLGYKKDEQK